MDDGYMEAALAREATDRSFADEFEAPDVPVYEVTWRSRIATGKFTIDAEHDDAELVAHRHLSEGTRITSLVCTYDPKEDA